MITSTLEHSTANCQASANTPAQKHTVNRVRKLAKHSYWLKRSGGYLDYMQYYFFNHSLKSSITSEVTKNSMEYCQHSWLRESKGEVTRFRGVGCGERAYCELCGSYVQLTLSREASRQMLDAITAVEVGGRKLESYGLKVVLPLRKDISKGIDNQLWSNFEGWQKEVNELFTLASKQIKAWFGLGVCFVLSLELTGESAPTEPHYHINAYVFPATLVNTGSQLTMRAISHWFEHKELEAMRDSWRDTQNEAYGAGILEGNFNIGYIQSKAKLFHWLRYLYKHPLSDTWRGWQGYDSKAKTLEYAYTKREGKERKRTTLTIPAKELARAYQRLDLIPPHFKRIRWYGGFSDGQRGKTMSLLGLERQEREGDIEGEGWTNEGYLTLVSYDKDGMTLKNKEGQLCKVVDSLVNYSPQGVSSGRRIIWLEPGATGGARASPKI